MNIRIYAIGIGDERETPIEFTDPNTGKVYRGTFVGGFDEELLKKIADKTGGAYFYAGSPGTLQAVFQAIDSIETVEKRLRINVETKSRHRLFIFIGLGLILLDFIIRRFFYREIL